MSSGHSDQMAAVARDVLLNYVVENTTASTAMRDVVQRVELSRDLPQLTAVFFRFGSVFMRMLTVGGNQWPIDEWVRALVAATETDPPLGEAADRLGPDGVQQVIRLLATEAGGVQLESLEDLPTPSGPMFVVLVGFVVELLGTLIRLGAEPGRLFEALVYLSEPRAEMVRNGAATLAAMEALRTGREFERLP